jgi:hypothetical protein
MRQQDMTTRSPKSTVYLNGKKLGIHPYAYTSFRFELTDDRLGRFPSVAWSIGIILYSSFTGR